MSDFLHKDREDVDVQLVIMNRFIALYMTRIAVISNQQFSLMLNILSFWAAVDYIFALLSSHCDK